MVREVGEMKFITIMVLGLYTHAAICDRYCTWSNKSTTITATCPTNKDALEKASKLKNCESMAEKQNCTDKYNFKYHCLINDLEDKLYEVCAPVFVIKGYCPEYNVKGARVQDHLYLRNGSIAYPFTSLYISSDFYKYPSCYSLVKSTNDSSFLSTFSQTTVESSNSSMDMPSDGYTTATLAFLLPVVLVPFVILVTIFFIFIYRLIYINDKTAEHEFDVESDLMLPIDEERKFDSDDSSSILSTASATDLYASIRGALLQEMSRGKESVDDILESSEDNQQITMNYLESHKCFDKYFVKTNFCRKAAATLKEEGIAVLTGKPGDGKTSTAVHILLSSSYQTWVKQKFTSWSDFRLIDAAKNSLVFIDNIYDGNMYNHDLDKWWDTFSNVISESRKKSKGKVHILITANENIIDKACEYMKRRTSVFREKFIIRTENFELSSDEKEAILKQQIEYAKVEKGIDPPKIESQFIRGLKTFNGIIGFPLCAHLYACLKDCRDSGIHFFKEPVQYIRRRIKYEIDVDRSGKVKTLFLVIFLLEIHVKNADEEVYNSISFKCANDCVKFLKDHYSGLIKDMHLKYNTFTKLLDVAREMMKLNLISHDGEEMYTFKHQTICHAVGHYFFTEHFGVVVKYFPVETFVHEEFVGRKEDDYDEMASRLYMEVEKGNHSKVFSCRLFQNCVFWEHFCKKIEKNENTRRFLLIPGDHSLPITFWVRKKHLFHLSKLIQNIIKRHAKKDAEFHFYLERFGECCAADENLLKKTDTASIVKLEEARNAVLNYRNGAGKSIVHIITVLEIPDIEVFTIITKLLRDTEAYTPSNVRDINDIEESLLTAVSQHTENSRILTILTLIKSRNSLNIEGYLLIYNTVSAFSSTEYQCYLEIELLLRVFIFLLYCNCESTDYRERTVQMCKSLKYDYVVELLSNETVTKCQSKISSTIDQISDTFTLDRCKEDTAIPNPMDSLSPGMVNSIYKCVQLLGDKSFREICI